MSRNDPLKIENVNRGMSGSEIFESLKFLADAFGARNPVSDLSILP